MTQLSTTDENKSGIYSTVDICKLIAAVLVVFIHANTLHTDRFFNMFDFAFTRFCVPFFFMVSGYFFENHIRNASDKHMFFRKYLRNTLMLYAVWVLLWLPRNIVMYCDLYPTQSWLYITMVLIRRYLFCGEGVYWYILITAESAAVIYWLIRLNKEKYLWILIFVGLLAGAVYDNHQFFDSKIVSIIHDSIYFVFSWSNNFIMKGIPFMGIGYLISKNSAEHQLPSVEILSAAFLLASFTNVVIYLHGIDFELMFIVQAVTYFCFSIQYKLKIKYKSSLVIRELSSSIYFLHTIFLYFVIEKIWSPELFIPLKVTCSILMSLIVYSCIKQLNKFHRLQYANFLLIIKEHK